MSSASTRTQTDKACDCVGFANAAGGTILLGIEDSQVEPLASQQVADDFPDRLWKQLAQITVNIGVAVRKVTAGNAASSWRFRCFETSKASPPLRMAGIPVVQQGDDRVMVRKQIVRPAIVDLMVKAHQTLQLSQKELITLGLLAQHEALTAIELVKTLELSHAEDLKL